MNRPRPPGRRGPQYAYSRWALGRTIQVIIDWYLAPVLMLAAIIAGGVVAYFLLVAWLT